MYYLISFDCEATGLSVYRDQIVEFGAAFSQWDATSGTMVSLESFTRRCKPSICTISKKAEEITGITMEALQNEACITSILDAFCEHVERICTDPTCPRILLSYNGFAYDIPLTVAELIRHERCVVSYFRRLCLHHVVDVLHVSRTALDTAQLKRRANGTCSYKLGDVYSSVCGRPLEGAHGSLADSQAVLDIIEQDTDVQSKLSTLLSGAGEDDNTGTHKQPCRNPMTFVQEVVRRVRKDREAKARGGRKRTIGTSIFDMMERAKKKKTVQ